MSLPRRVIPGEVYLITRRCTQRQFLLRPGKRTNQAFLYCVGEAAHRFGIKIIAVLASSNHYHAVVLDPDGRYPEFLAHFHRMAAKVLNVNWSRWENLWASEQTSRVDLLAPEDRFGKMIYTLTNPVKDHLVDKATNWPGATSLHAQLGDARIIVARPHWFFDKNGKMPLEVELRFHRLPGYEHLSHEAWAEMIRTAIAEVERTAANKRAKTGRRVLGRKTVLRQSPFDRPRSHEPRRELSPRVAAKNKWRRIEALRRNKEWLQAYRTAFATRRAGDPNVLFPAGTYKLRVLGLVRCAAPPA